MCPCARSNGKKRAHLGRQHDRQYAKVQPRLQLQRLKFLVGRWFGVSHGQCSNRGRRNQRDFRIGRQHEHQRRGHGAKSVRSALGSLEVVVGRQAERHRRRRATVTLNPGWYNNGLHITSNQVVTLNPGVYYIDGAGGNFQIDSGAVITGTGVTFVLTSSTGKSNSYPSVAINGSSSMHITAPTSNSALGTDSSGVAIFEDPKASGNLTINGNSNTYFGGAIVAPSMAISFSGTGVSGTASNCTQIIGDTITFTGNSSVSSDCGNYGTATIGGTGKTVLSE